MVNEERFIIAKEMAESAAEPFSIGRISEKSVHKVLKYYFEPDSAKHEIQYMNYVADIKNEVGIIEIQTRAFDRLVPKLTAFLAECRVTLVYPVIVEKTLFWIDEESGAITKGRRVSKKGRASDILPELSKLGALSLNPGFSLKLVYLKASEFRFLDGYGEHKKRRATKVNILPTELVGVDEFCCAEDYKRLLPDILPEIFTANIFNKSTRLRGRRAYFALKYCNEIGLVSKIGKEKNAFLYSKNK